MGKEKPLQGIKQLDMFAKKQTPPPHIIIHSKWKIDLNIHIKATKLEDNIGEYSYDLGIRKIFLERT